MNIQDKNLRNHLAAEYVLGTLIGAARKRFEVYMQQDPSLQVLVQRWGQVLHPMGSMVKPVKPPKRVWKSIEQRLQLNDGASGFWKNLFFWRSLSFLSASAAIIIGLYLGPFTLIQKVDIEENYLAVVENGDSQGAWLVSTDINKKSLKVRTLITQKLASNKDFELWLLPASDGRKSFKAPISVGLISANKQSEIQLSDKLLMAMQQAGGVAVSLEPKGGSPTGLPTGPVLYQGKLRLL